MAKMQRFLFTVRCLRISTNTVYSKCLRLTSSAGSHASMPPIDLPRESAKEREQGESYQHCVHRSGVNVKLEGKHPTSRLHAVGGTSMPCCQAIRRWEIRV